LVNIVTIFILSIWIVTSWIGSVIVHHEEGHVDHGGFDIVRGDILDVPERNSGVIFEALRFRLFIVLVTVILRLLAVFARQNLGGEIETQSLLTFTFVEENHLIQR
jgi:hypothetical protein